MAEGAEALGYYTLSAHNVKRDELPEEIIRKLKLPKYPFIPATLMGRLEVHTDRKGKRIGEMLLMDALERSLANSKNIASFAVVVDTKENAIGFYRRYGFLHLPPGNRMFLPMRTIEKLFTPAQESIAGQALGRQTGAPHRNVRQYLGE